MNPQSIHGIVGLCAAAAVVLTPLPASAGRLFGTAPGFEFIFELDPDTAEIINTIPSPPQWPLDGLAFDGESLWYIGADINTLYQIDPDNGDVENIFDLPAIVISPENNNSGVRGALAFLNGEIYITNWDFQVQDIEVFDPAVGEVVRVLDIDGANPGARRFANSGLAALTGPDQLVVSTALTQEIFYIDPFTGEITDSFVHNQFGVLGIAVIDDQLYLGSDQIGPDFDGIEDIHVYTRDGVEIRNMVLEGTNGIHSLAGGNTVPEPGSLALITLGAFVASRRRRRPA